MDGTFKAPSRMSEIGRHKTTIGVESFGSDWFAKVRYHDTDVVSFGLVECLLDTGGWYTPTTKKRMNQTSQEYGLGFHVFQKKQPWKTKHDAIDHQDWFVKIGDRTEGFDPAGKCLLYLIPALVE